MNILTDEKTNPYNEKQSKIDKNEIDYLRKELKKQTKKNKKIIDGQKEKLVNQHEQIKELITEKVKLEMQDMIETLSLEAPYVHVKITKILGGKGKKGEISISGGGSIEKINTDDMKNFCEMMIKTINEKVDYALQELQKDEETE